ncbi:hypothetical protein ACWEVY_28480 [Streptomyces longwoodensis]
MKLSELIADAQRTLDEFGDIPVVIRDPGCGCCASGFEEAGTHVEKHSVEVWENNDHVKIPTAFVVS